MKRAANPFGDKDRADSVLVQYCAGNFVLCGWGFHGNHLGRDEEVKRLLLSHGHDIHCLDFTIGGQPKHPLYVAYDQQPHIWKRPRSAAE